MCVARVAIQRKMLDQTKFRLAEYKKGRRCIMILGNFAASLYVLIALMNAHGDWGRFWLGNRLR